MITSRIVYTRYGGGSGWRPSRRLALQLEVGEQGGGLVVCELGLEARRARSEQPERQQDGGDRRSRRDEERKVVAADQRGGDPVVGGEKGSGVVGRHGA